MGWGVIFKGTVVKLCRLGIFFCRLLTFFSLKLTFLQKSMRLGSRSERGGSRISGKGVHIYIYICKVREFHLIFLKYPLKRNNLVSLRPNHFIFTGYLKTEGRVGGGAIERSEPPLNPPLPDLRSNLFSKVISRRQKLQLATNTDTKGANLHETIIWVRI